MKLAVVLLLMVVLPSCAIGDGKAVYYHVDGREFEGYYVSPSQNAPLVLLVHDWDGLTEYEVTRAGMLAELGYAVFAADLFGAGVRPESVEKRQQLTGQLYQNREEMRSILPCDQRNPTEGKYIQVSSSVRMRMFPWMLLSATMSDSDSTVMKLSAAIFVGKPGSEKYTSFLEAYTIRFSTDVMQVGLGNSEVVK